MVLDNEFRKSARHKLLDKIKNNSIVVLFAGKAPQKTADEEYQFTPNRNFYYLTGIYEQEHILVMQKDDNKVKSIMYIKDINPEMEKWVGKTLRKDEAQKLALVDEVKFISQFDDDLNRIIGLQDEINMYLDLERSSSKSTNNISQSFSNMINLKYPQVRIHNIYNKIGELRLVKDETEINNIRKAIDITISGIELMMKEVKAGMMEYELEAHFDFNCKTKGVKDLAFKTILASGKNATVLHYVDNNSELKDGDLIQLDLGAQYNYYNADISRVFPVNGKFTERQKDVYNAVLRVNEEIIGLIKVGETFVNINNKAKDLIAEECIKLGLIEDKKDVGKYYYHSIGHSLGLDTHDVEVPHRNITFKEGVVYTVEPGIYIEEEGIGIRIEDDILVTKEGNENLTKNIIKTVDEIEEFMKKQQLK